jgi:ABC-type nitrate/sulfonate/bicarbonate transport system substrate-binding protein
MATPVDVLLPDGDNLQYSAFWAALGAGYFTDEGVQPHLVIPEIPAQAIARVLRGDAPVAVLPPPVYLQLIADRFPIVLVANLLRNDPIDVVVRRSVFAARGMSASVPLRDRLSSLRGLRVCVAPGPPARLRALFASVGMNADTDLRIVIRRGPDQNGAFARDECDALYAHTPYLEKAIDDQDAVMLVDQSAGDAPVLATRQIHALVARRDYLGAHGDVVSSMVRAVARAEHLFGTDAAAAEAAIANALPALDRRHLHTLLGIYGPAIPETPQVAVEGLEPALALFPANKTAPSLAGVPLADFVASNLADARWSATGAASTTSPPNAPTTRGRGPMLVAGLVVLAAVGWWLLARSRGRRSA